jgi:hypothetical protein
MKQAITLIALVVRDVDEAIDFYTRQLNFDLVEDTYQAEQDKRWVVVSPPGSAGVSLRNPSLAIKQAATSFSSSPPTTSGDTIRTWWQRASTSFESQRKKRTARSLFLKISMAISGILLKETVAR